ncbi:MAG: hypothetical protein V1743_02275, partial [Nanoarchaeota archaeon]
MGFKKRTLENIDLSLLEPRGKQRIEKILCQDEEYQKRISLWLTSGDRTLKKIENTDLSLLA